MKRTITVLIICLMIIPSIIINAENESNKTIFVDDDNVNGPWLGTQKYPFRIIQEAVNTANDGDTVFVFSGIYDEYLYNDWIYMVIVNKSINLMGENRDTTIIEGVNTDFGILLIASNITICGITTKNSRRGIYMVGDLENIDIYDNLIISHKTGIHIEQYTTQVRIYDNIIANNENYGIHTRISNSYIEIFNNIILDNHYGIYSISGNKKEFYTNLIMNNSIGILSKNDRSSIHQNQIIDNDVGVKLEDTSSFINHNNFFNNAIQASINRREYLIKLLSLSKSNNEWDGNYWDDWIRKTPRKINGSADILFRIISIHPKLSTVIILGTLTYNEYDSNPAIEPFDIEVGV